MLPNDATTVNAMPNVRAYKCLAYMREPGAEVTETYIVAADKQAARDLFAAELGAEKIKEGIVIEVFPAA